MSIKWFSKKEKNAIATFSENSINLNVVALRYMNNSSKVMIGIDDIKNELIIKSYKDEENTLDSEYLYNLVIATSYGRITNSYLIKEIEKTLNIKFLSTKYLCKYDNIKEELVIDFNSRIK